MNTRTNENCLAINIINNENKILTDKKLKEIDNLDFLINELEKLYMLMDDIDTYSDMAKSDDKLYRALVERRIKRYTHADGLIGSDGYGLFEVKKI